MNRAIRALVVSMLCLWIGASRASAQSGTLPKFGHVIFVPLENHSYSSVVGSSSMPYLNSLIAKYGLATNYFADTHPSIGNYFVWTTGQILTNDDGQTPSSFPVSVDNIAHELELAGKTWKDYPETSGSYIVRHDPLQYMTNINSSNLLDFTHFKTDLSNHALPNFSFITPNGCDDAHDCGLSTADSWLQTNIDPLVKSTYFQPGGDGLLIIAFDEDSSGGSCGLTTGTGCGGHVACVIISPFIVSAGFQSSGSFEHENVLKLIAQGLGLTTFPGAAARAANMSEFFSTTSSSTTVTLSPSSVSFGNQAVGTTSSAQTLTLRNGTTSSVSISSIGVTGTNSSLFTETNNCGSSLAAAASCTISVTFKPTTTGSFSATLSVSDNATGSPQTSSLSGAGVTATANVSPTSLSFGNQAVGTTSAAQFSTLTNNGNTTLTINSLVISGAPFAFAGLGTCGSTLAAGASCTISVDFAPTTTGTFTGTVTVNDTATSSPQTISLSGTGGSSSTSGTVSVSPTSLSFGNQTVGTTSAAQFSTVTNTGSTTLTINSLQISGAPFAFAGLGTCGSTLAAGASCTISVDFAPTTSGTFTGTVTINDSATGSPQTISLSGTGGSSSSSATVSVSPTSLNFGKVTVGNTSTLSVAVKNTGSSTVTISGATAAAPFAASRSCGSLGNGATCTINVTYTPTGPGPDSGTLTITDNATGSPQTVSLTGHGSKH